MKFASGVAPIHPQTPQVPDSNRRVVPVLGQRSLFKCFTIPDKLPNSRLSKPDPWGSVISKLAHLHLRRWLIRVFLLLAENIENLVYGVRLLLRILLLALIGIRILLPQQIPQNTGGPAQRIVRTGHQVLQFHLGDLLNIGSEYRMLDMPVTVAGPTISP